MKKQLIYHLILIITSLVANHRSIAQNPLAYWTFDNSNPLADIIKGSIADTARYHNQITVGAGSVGNGVFPATRDGLLVTSALPEKAQAITVEFMFKGNEFFFSTFPEPSFRLVAHYDYIQFTTTTVAKNVIVDHWIVNLRGNGINSYNNLSDGNWHHVVFRVDGKTGTKQIWIDGQTNKLLTKEIHRFDFIQVQKASAFSRMEGLDEVAVYDTYLSDDLIKQHYLEVNNNRHYSFGSQNLKASAGTAAVEIVDPKEFAPGYPDYTVQATDQLKTFPDPRYFPGHNLPRNFPWLDISYLHRELKGNGGMGLGQSNPQKAIELTDEMVKRWNYYAEIRCLRQDTVTALKTYNDPNTLEHALIKYANNNPSVPLAAVIMQVQNKPVHAGYKSHSPYVLSQELPDKYYLRDKTGKEIIYNNKKWITPLAPLDIVEYDANTTVTYLRQVAKVLKRPVDMLNDNGEVFGHMRTADLLNMDPDVVKLQTSKKWNVAELNGWFQYRMDSVYKNFILNKLGWKNTLFTIYNTSAVNSNYWPDYSFRRNTNSLFNGSHRSTPSFYPAFPWNWKLASGQYNGYGVIAEGRRKEIEMGDKLFAPFISAGWGLEENNIRPAQWLGLLKSMVMLGADFFHVGYFNVTGGGGWPNGKGPNDPRGYIYQVAMPSYAQAIASRVFPFIENGELLNPSADTSVRGFDYRFPAGNESHLVMVRKLGKKYLIFGTVQPNGNYIGNAPVIKPVSIKLENR
ncbi:MAG TPA: hypothetical protein VIK74_10385, partial [Parasegetibacter sp.]